MAVKSLDTAPYTSLQGRTDDGKEIKASGRPITETTVSGLRAHADRLWELVANPLPFSEVGTLNDLLRDGMPKLELLRVHVEVPEEQADEQLPMAKLNIHPLRLPALRSLVLYRCGVPLAPPLVSHLRRLVMENTLGHTQLLPLTPFLDCLRYLDCLEELQLSNCFAPLAEEDCRSPVPSSTSRLMTIVIEEHPSTISQILSALIVPARANVRLKADLRGATTEQCAAAFMEMLPGDRQCLPILQHVSHLEVYHPPEACYIVGKTEAKDTIDIELVTDALDRPLLQQVRGELFEMMIGTVGDIFPRAPIKSAAFLGDVDYVSPVSWIAGLGCFPKLQHLQVDDVELRGSPQKVVAALMAPSPTFPEHPICHLIEHLSLYGDATSADILERIYQCLKSRKERGGPAVLRRLDIELYCDTEVVTNAEREHYHKLLSSLAERTVLHIFIEPGRRSR
ncbi:hypothetical protein OH77DRAFT_74340 [Trametes cingulata]|nr:hypothetical protein OH77DRAFT_74340 [Trametes cingulata]